MDEVFQLNTHLHFGAVVHISHFINRTNFYIFTNGVSYRNLLSYSSNDPPTQTSKALFRIKPAIKFQQDEFLQSIVKQRYQQKTIQTDQKKAKMFIDQFQFQLKQNTQFSQQQYRFPIKYNQSFMLQHMYSCKYLSFTKQIQSNEFLLELCQIPNVNSLFSLQPCYNYQKDINTYIPFNSASFLNMKVLEGLDVRDLFINFRMDSVFHCWKIQEEQKAVISVGLFQTAQEIAYKEICYGDTVWIFHLESGSFARIKHNQQKKQFDSYIMRKIKYALGYIEGQYKQEQNEKDQVKNAPQIVLQRTQNETTAQKFGLWQIVYASEKGNNTNRKQHSDRFKGGRVKFDQQVRFFSLRYKQYLSVRKIKVGRNKFQFQLCTQKFQQQNTTFKIKSLSPSSLYCTTQDLFVIQHCLSQCYLTLSQQFKPTDKHSLLIPSEQYKKQDNFKFTKIEFIQNWQNNYVLSIISFLVEGTRVFERVKGKDGNCSRKEEVLLELLLENLIQILSFSYDLTEGFEASQNKLGKMTYNHSNVQNLLKQQGIIDILINLLRQIGLDIIEMNRSQFKQLNKKRSKNQNILMQPKQKKSSSWNIRVNGILKILKNFTPDPKSQAKRLPIPSCLLNNIINMSFKILRNCCKNNSENSLYLFSHLETFIPYLSIGSYAETFFVDSFVNVDILEKINQREFRLIIGQYVRIFKKTQEYTPEVFNLLMNFVRLDDVSISKNQVEIYKLFFDQFNPLIFQIQDSDGRFFVTYQRYKHQLTDFSKKFQAQSLTLATQIKFFGYLTFSRNYLCSKQMKKKFSLSTLLFYLSLPSLSPSIKQGLIHLLINSYLNQRPRFKQQKHFIYSFYNIYSSQQFHKSLSNKPQRKNQNQYSFEMKEMEIRGINQQGQRDILQCIQDVNYVTNQQLDDIKKWLKEQLNKAIKDQNNQTFYTNVMQANLLCLKQMIQLDIFTNKQSQYIQSLLISFMKRISASLQLTNQTNIKLQSSNFKTLLLEMVQKNVIKRYDFNNKFDGIQNQITEDNICSIYVNYAFYQNILLMEKNQHSKNQYDRVIQKIIELIEVHNKIVIQDKLIDFLADVLDQEKHYINKESKKILAQKVLINKIFEDSFFTKKENSIQILLLLFYNSNSYDINLKTISLFIKQNFTQNSFLQSLQKIIFIVNEEEHKTNMKMMSLYKQIRLLIETSEVWLDERYDKPTYKYNSIILYFVDQIKSIISLCVRNYKKDSHHHGSSFTIFDSIIGLQPHIIRQQQIIISNLNMDSQIISFIQNYIHILKNIQRQEDKNVVVITLFRTCFLLLYVYVYGCSQNKQKLCDIISGNRGDINVFFMALGKVDFGQSRLLVEYLKDNYQASTEFMIKNAQTLQKNNKYTWIYGQLILVLLKYYNQSIVPNLKSFFVSIFDYTSFKTYLWMSKSQTQLNLSLSFFQQSSYEPIFYHIKMIQTLLYLSSNLPEASNTIKSHIQKSLSQQYLYSLLDLQDYYSKQNSIKTILKLMVIFKAKIMKLIQAVYLYTERSDRNLPQKLLKKFHQMVNTWVEEAPARQETDDFRKSIPVRDLKADLDTNVDRRITQVYNSIYRNEFLLQIYIQSMQAYCRSILKSQVLSSLHPLSQSIIHKVFSLNQILHRTYSHKSTITNYLLPNEQNFKILIPQQKPQYNRKKYFISLGLELQFQEDVFKKIRDNQAKMVRVLMDSLAAINLKPFLFLRKISEFLEDAFENLPNDYAHVYETVQGLLKFLTIWLRSLPSGEANQLRVQMGKSQLIFPILNYFETCNFSPDNKKLFLISLQYLTELVGVEGNKFVQTIFNNYFTNKSDSIQFFMKIKSIMKGLFMSDHVSYQCKKLLQGIEVYKRQVCQQKTQQFLLLNFLIALCKGNFRQNQIFLSSLSNTSNFKIMGGIWEILKMQEFKYPKHLINNKNFHLITQCFATIRELVEGPCSENQNQFLKRQFFMTVLKYFQYQQVPQALILEQNLEIKMQEMSEISKPWTSQLRAYLNEQKITKQWMPSQVKYLCINLISSLLSQNINQNSISQLMTINPQILAREIDKVYQRYLELQLQYTQQNLDYSQNRQVILPLGFKLYQVLQYFPKQKQPQQTVGIQFFRKNSRVIEIMHNDLSIVYFPKPVHEISQAFRMEFLQDVDRTSINSKLRDLQNVEIQNRQSDFPYGYVFFMVVAVMVIMDFVILTPQVLPYVEDFTFYPIFQGYLSFVDQTTIKGILIIVAILMSAAFFALQIKGAVYMKETTLQILEESTFTSFDKFVAIAKLYGQNLSYLYYFMALILLILGLWNPFFDAVLLVAQLFRRNQTFSIILKAITQTLDQLCITLLVLVIATYILTSIIYYYYGQRYFSDSCKNLYFCFMFSLDQGFVQDAGIVGIANGNDATTQPNIVVDFLNVEFTDVMLNFIYLFIIKLIISQIIGAIIVDKFADMRSQKQALEQDENSVCFICGIDRNTLDRQQDGFQQHKEQYHNVFNYMQFLIHIQNAKKSNLSGIQRFVYEQKQKGKLNWFPINRSFHLQNKKKLEQQNSQQNSDQNSAQVLFDKNMKQIDSQINQINFNMTQMNQMVNLKLLKQKRKQAIKV